MLKATMKSAIVRGIAIAVPSLAGAEPVRLRVTNGLAPTHVVSVQGIDPWMVCVTDRTGGEVTFDYFPGGQISTVKDTTDALAAGLADIGFMSPSNEGSKLPLNAIAMLPGGGNSAVEITSAYRASLDAGSPLAQELAILKLRPFIVNGLAPYQIMSRSKLIDTFDAFSGVKVPVAGGAMTSSAMSLKAVPTEMAAGDLYIAMERGTVDATIFAMSSVKTYSLHELVTSMSRNASLGTSTQFFGISDAGWDKLSVPQQEAVVACGLEVEKSLADYLDHEQAQLIKEFEAAGISIYEFAPEELAKINTALEVAAREYVARVAARGLPAQEAFDSLRPKATN